VRNVGRGFFDVTDELGWLNNRFELDLRCTRAVVRAGCVAAKRRGAAPPSPA
jgi:hypothetical protein